MKPTYKVIPAFSFGFLTPFYDLLSEFVGFGQSLKKYVLDLAELQDRESLLDIGYGTGSLVIVAKTQMPELKNCWH